MMGEQGIKHGPHGMAGRGSMGEAADRPRDFIAAMKRLAGYCREFLPAILIALLAAAGGTFLRIIGPNKLKDMTNEIMKGLPSVINGKQMVGQIDMSVISNIAWTLTLFYAAAFLLNYIQSLLMATVT
ncbi:MAG TPA: ABC transporter ATP-binding protein, partial [Lachnospiraceae bacterium]|nr:ABC transporter ATP-binding protein [Lachnospiraceae bacterium]